MESVCLFVAVVVSCESNTKQIRVYTDVEGVSDCVRRHYVLLDSRLDWISPKEIPPQLRRTSKGVNCQPKKPTHYPLSYLMKREKKVDSKTFTKTIKAYSTKKHMLSGH